MYPSSFRRRAISTFILEVGISTFSCSALLALRMRESMSAIGSVSMSSLLPAGLRHARDRALVRELAQADAAKAELFEHGTRTTTAVTPRVVAHPVLLRTLLLDDERCLRHYWSLLSPSPLNGRPMASSSARAWSSVSADVVIVTSRPRTSLTSS